MRKSRGRFVLVLTAVVAAAVAYVPAAGSISDHFVQFLFCWRVPPCSAVLLLCSSIAAAGCIELTTSCFALGVLQALRWELPVRRQCTRRLV
jgi:hypothetical protein